MTENDFSERKPLTMSFGDVAGRNPQKEAELPKLRTGREHRLHAAERPRPGSCTVQSGDSCAALGRLSSLVVASEASPR